MGKNWGGGGNGEDWRGGEGEDGEDWGGGEGEDGEIVTYLDSLSLHMYISVHTQAHTSTCTHTSLLVSSVQVLWFMYVHWWT